MLHHFYHSLTLSYGLFSCSQYGNSLYLPVRIIAIKALKEFWKKHSDAEQPLRAWYAEAKIADWNKPADITKMYRSASILTNNRVVFNIKGNNYRLVTVINYEFKVTYIRFIGTHKEYDKINAKEI
jgi:mRNA interferase HigB